MRLLQQLKYNSYNTRAPKMWSIISKNVEFEGKSVLDLGCGYGDMLILSHFAGASKIKGVDMDSYIISHTRGRITENIVDSGIILSIDNIETMQMENFDIIVCFSVLPYLEDAVSLLKKIRGHSKIALLEIQYAGDGPGTIKNNKDMRQYLSEIGWNRITNLGYTDLEIRPAKRTIWRCRDES